MCFPLRVQKSRASRRGEGRMGFTGFWEVHWQAGDVCYCEKTLAMTILRNLGLLILFHSVYLLSMFYSWQTVAVWENTQHPRPDSASLQVSLRVDDEPAESNQPDIPAVNIRWFNITEPLFSAIRLGKNTQALVSWSPHSVWWESNHPTTLSEHSEPV